MKYQPYFLVKNKKNVTSVSSAEFAQRVPKFSRIVCRDVEIRNGSNGKN